MKNRWIIILLAAILLLVIWAQPTPAEEMEKRQSISATLESVLNATLTATHLPPTAAAQPSATPEPSPAQIEAAMQSVLATAAAGWTATPSPTTEPSATQQPSATPPPPTASFTPAASATATAPPSTTPWPSATPIPNHLLRTAAPLKLENNSGQGVSLILDGPAYFVVNFSTPLYFIDKVPRGTYTFTAYIGENGPYTGTLHIPNSDQHTLVFHTDKVTIKGP